MLKVKRVIKSGIAFLLITVLMLSSVSLGVFADPDVDAPTAASNSATNAKELAGHMMANFMDGGQGDLQIKDISEEEFRAFAVLLSNFVIPLHTDATNLDEEITTGTTKYKTWEHFCKTWMKSGSAANGTLMKALKERYETCFTTDYIKPLYQNESEVKVTVKTLCGIEEIRNSDFSCNWKDEKGVYHEVFSLTYTGKAIISFIRSLDTEAMKNYVDRDLDVYISPFGDLCVIDSGKTVILMPACLNPYSFGNNDVDDIFRKDMFYANNVFVLSNFLEKYELNKELNVAGSKIFNDLGEVQYGTFEGNTDAISEKSKPKSANSIIDTENNNYYYGTFFLKNIELANTRGKNGSVTLSELLNPRFESMVPYVQVDRDRNVVAGLAPYCPDDTILSDTNGQSKNTSVYYSAIQSLWSVATPLAVAKNSANRQNNFSIVSRSSLIDREHIYFSQLAAIEDESGDEGSKHLETKDFNWADLLVSSSVTLRPFGYWHEDKGGVMNSDGVDLYVMPGRNYKNYTLPSIGERYFANAQLKLQKGDEGYNNDLQLFGNNEQLTYSEIASSTTAYLNQGLYGNEGIKKARENANNAEVEAKNEAKFLLLTLIGVYNSQESANNNDLDPRYCSTIFQIPIDSVVTKLGVFNQFLTDVDGNSLDTVQTINYADDGENTLLAKTGHPAFSVKSTKNFIPSWSDPKPADITYMPEYLYTLNINKNNSLANGAIQFGEFSSNLNFNRGLFAEIYWAYIEDIVGITSEDIKKGIDSNASGIKVNKKIDFSYLPKMSSEGFKKNLFTMTAPSDETSDAIEQENFEKKQADIISMVYNILIVGKSIGEVASSVAIEATNFVVGWLKGLTDGMFIAWHNSIVGIDMTSFVTGSVSNIGNASRAGVYTSAVGYMTTPNFNELPITGWLIANYQYVYVCIMALIVVILLFMIINRTRRLPQAILIFVCMAFVVVLPLNMLNGALDISNSVTESIYADKFEYWALMQHAEYLMNQSTANNSIQTSVLDSLDRQSEANKVGGVTLRWMAPKKWGIAERLSSATNGGKGLKLFLYLAGDVLDSEDYSNYTAGDTFLYRPYLALFTEAKLLHTRQQANVYTDTTTNDKSMYLIPTFIKKQWFKTNSDYKVINKRNSDEKVAGNMQYNAKQKKSTSSTTITAEPNDSNFFRYLSVRGDSILRPAFGGFSVGYTGKQIKQNGLNEYSGYEITIYPDAFYDTYYGSAKIITDKQSRYQNHERIYDLYLDKKLINAIFDFRVDDVLWSSKLKNDPCGIWLYSNGKSSSNSRVSDSTAGNEDLQENSYTIGVQTFFDYSESPYYYFYNVLSDKVVKSDNGSDISGDYDFLALLLSDDTFKVTSTESIAYGEVKDFLDMEGLFRFVIPLLNYANQDAQIYFNTYGATVDKLDFTEDTPLNNSSTTETSKAAEASESETSETENEVITEGLQSVLKQPETVAEEQYNMHKQQLQAIWNMYSPWVDQFISANSTTQKVRSGYGTVELMEPWNPADYQYFDRPMSFSPAEAVIRGYKSYDLSDVENKIQNVLNNTYKDMIELINYKDLTGITTDDNVIGKSNDILISAAAMIATFNFNKEFSDIGFMSTNTQLYPISFELKNMNFDAYLRIIMGNSMGVNQISSRSSYSNIYEEFIKQTSPLSGLLLIVEDNLAVFIIPLMKILLVVVIFILSLVLAVSCIINKPENMIRIFLTTFIVPLLSMIAIFIGHSVVISWFIGDGSVAKLIDTHSISITTGDPTMTLLLMAVVDITTIVLMWKLLKFSFKSTTEYIKSIIGGIAALGKGVLDVGLKAVAALAGVGTIAANVVNAQGKLTATEAKLAYGGVKLGVKGVKAVKKHFSKRGGEKDGDGGTSSSGTNSNTNSNSNSNTNSNINSNNNSNTNTNTNSNNSSDTNTNTNNSGQNNESGQGVDKYDKQFKSMAEDLSAIKRKIDNFSPDGKKVEFNGANTDGGGNNTGAGGANGANGANSANGANGPAQPIQSGSSGNNNNQRRFFFPPMAEDDWKWKDGKAYNWENDHKSVEANQTVYSNMMKSDKTKTLDYMTKEFDKLTQEFDKSVQKDKTKYIQLMAMARLLNSARL